MPDLRLTPERRAEIRHAIKHNPEVDAQDALDLLHDLDVLERQRDEALALVVALCRATGITADAVRAELNRRAALAERGGEPHGGAHT